MSYGYIYVPKNGKVWSLAIYCNKPGNPPHTVTGNVDGDSGFSVPVDVGETGWRAGDDILFRATTNIYSFKVNHFGKVCGNLAEPWTFGVKLDLYTGYNATGTKIGVVLYGHLQNRIGNGIIKNRPATGSWAEYIGEVPADCLCGCSTGIHVHMECKGGSRNSFYCNQPVTTSNWIYRWVMPA